MRYLFVGDSAHAALESSALLGKFDTFALPLFDDAAFELVKRTDERQHKFRSAGDVHPVLKAQTFFHKLERNTAMRQFFALSGENWQDFDRGGRGCSGRLCRRTELRRGVRRAQAGRGFDLS